MWLLCCVFLFDVCLSFGGQGPVVLALDFSNSSLLHTKNDYTSSVMYYIASLDKLYHLYQYYIRYKTYKVMHVNAC